jgi:hypothetical protein
MMAIDFMMETKRATHEVRMASHSYIFVSILWWMWRREESGAGREYWRRRSPFLQKRSKFMTTMGTPLVPCITHTKMQHMYPSKPVPFQITAVSSNLP